MRTLLLLCVYVERACFLVRVILRGECNVWCDVAVAVGGRLVIVLVDGVHVLGFFLMAVPLLKC